MTLVQRIRPGSSALAFVSGLAAAAALTPLFADLSWLPYVFGTVAAVVISSAAGRALKVPAYLSPLVSTSALILAMTAMFADSAILGFLPGPEALAHMRSLLGAGMVDSAALAAPAVPTVGLAFLAAGGIGLVVLAVDAFAITLDLPGWAGIPLAFVYLIPAAALPGGAPRWILPVLLAPWLGLIAINTRLELRSWGKVLRPIGPYRRAIPRASGILAAIAVVAVASIAATRLPGLSESTWGRGSDMPGVGGSGGAVSIDPMVSLRRNLLSTSNTEVLRYNTTAEHPSYLRLTVLNSFDGTVWSAEPEVEGTSVPLLSPLDPVANPFEYQRGFDGQIVITDIETGKSLVRMVETSQVQEDTYDITTAELVNQQLPLPFPAYSVVFNAQDASHTTDWAWNTATRSVSSSSDTGSHLRYIVQTAQPEYTPAILRTLTSADVPDVFQTPADTAGALELPEATRATVAELAAQITAGAKSPYGKAVALQDWFTSNFTYTTDVVDDSNDPLGEFLKDKKGYCQQFSGAFAAMARSLGIPARVVVGFTAGTQNADGTWVVTAKDAHAWPEILLPNVGWLPFEPTPRVASTVTGPTYAPQEIPKPATPTPAPSATQPASPSVPNSNAATPAATSGGRGSSPWWLLGLAALVGLLAAIPSVVASMRRRRRWADANTIDATWEQLRSDALSTGGTWSDSWTPRQAAGELEQFTAHHGALALLVDRTEALRYRPVADASESPESLEFGITTAQEICREVRAERVQRMSLLGRIRVRIFP